jgi:hypothetical protein
MGAFVFLNLHTNALQASIPILISVGLPISLGALFIAQAVNERGIP